MRVLAIDWSGALRGAERKIWLAEAAGGQLPRLECGRTREGVAAHLIAEAARTPRMVVGLDFAFSLPEWFFAANGLRTASELWALAEREAERWLAECRPPFWGRRGTHPPEPLSRYRVTEREAPRSGGIQAKSVFQIAGAGAVGTGSLRGMPVLACLQRAGFSIWPFDAPGWPLVVEIYPRLLTGAVNKSDPARRAAYLADRHSALDAEMRNLAASSEDAFDAAVSALVMARHTDQLKRLAPAADRRARLEGQIWSPPPAAAGPSPSNGIAPAQDPGCDFAGAGHREAHLPSAVRRT